MLPIIKVENLTFSYPATKANRKIPLQKRLSPQKFSLKRPADSISPNKPVFNDFSLTVEKGARLIVRGKSGSGKTTLLRLLAWLEEPISGTLYFNKKPYQKYNPPELRKSVALVTQRPVLLEGTALYNLGLGLDDEPDEEVILDWMERFGLDSDLLHKPASSLSVGQAQRIAVIRTLLIKPKVLLLDEPTSGLDPESTRMFITALKNIGEKEEMTIIWNSHDYAATRHIATDTITIEEPKL